MTREQLDQRNTAAIRRHYRTLTDTGGTPPQALLDDLAATADQHADDILHEEVGVSGQIAPPTMPSAGSPPRARRTTTPRRTAK